MTADIHAVLVGEKLKAPFPWFGGKSRVADVVWRAFGNVPNYVEPFAGSLAVLLGRPHAAKIETVNDLDCYLANWWRAVQAAPAEVARWADWPVNEADMHARQSALLSDLEVHRQRMHADPSYFDVQKAGWWVWGISASIGGNWLMPKGANARPYMHGGRVGYGIHQSLPAIGHSGRGVHSPEREALGEWFCKLSARLRRTRVACGDWARVVSGSVTGASNTASNMGMQPCGVFLDPPYDLEERTPDCYREDAAGVSGTVRAWAIEHGDVPELRIALCGYEGEHEMPSNWTVHAWKSKGGYSNQGLANANAHRERIWFSPHCLPLEETQTALFGAGR